MQRHPLIATAAGICLLAAACGGGDSADGSEGDPTVVVTTAVLGDVVENLVGDLATVEVLMPRDADPHEFQPSARQVVAMSEADLLVTNGGGLEAGLDDAIDGAVDDGVPIFAAIDHVDTLDPAGSDDASDSPEGDDHVDELPEDLRIVNDQVLRYALDLEPADLASLIGMTPHGFRSRPERQQALLDTGVAELEVAMRMVLLQRCQEEFPCDNPM